MNTKVITRGVRTHQLIDLGLKYNGADFTLDDINVHWTELTCDTDEEWIEKIEKIRKEIERRNIGDN